MLKRKQDEYSDTYHQRGKAPRLEAHLVIGQKKTNLCLFVWPHTVICATRESEIFSLIGVEPREDLVP
jgi:hypothetical protein